MRIETVSTNLVIRPVSALARVGLLEGLTEAQLDVAALAAEETNVQAGAEIVKKGATGATMFGSGCRRP